MEFFAAKTPKLFLTKVFLNNILKQIPGGIMQINTQEIEQTIRKIDKDGIIKVICSNRNKEIFDFRKIELENKNSYYLESRYTQKQVFNKKVESENLPQTLVSLLPYFKQINILCKNCEYEIKITKKDKVFVFKKTREQAEEDPNHNRTKTI